MNILRSLKRLDQLSPQEMHHTNLKVRAQMAGADWRMAVCLLATARRGLYRSHSCSSITEYGEKILQLAPQKTGELVHTAKVLEKLPALSEAFRTGKIGWGKMREIKRVVTPETEAQWLSYALTHKTDEIRKKVALSPREWKRNQALQASQEGAPKATPEEVELLLEEEGVPPATDSAPKTSSGQDPEKDQAVAAGQTEHVSIDAPRKIRLVFHLTPDQYALYEQAESRVRAQAGKRVCREMVLTKMAETTLAQGSARARARHQVVISTDPETGISYYDTARGPLPVDEEVLVEALTNGNYNALPDGSSETATEEDPALEPQAALDQEINTESGHVTGSPHKRKLIPNWVLRAVFARAGNRCERCGRRGGRLHVHHLKPVSDGGVNRVDTLLVLCEACHSLLHEEDFDTRADWRRARDRNRSRLEKEAAKKKSRRLPRGRSP